MLASTYLNTLPWQQTSHTDRVDGKTFGNKQKEVCTFSTHHTTKVSMSQWWAQLHLLGFNPVPVFACFALPACLPACLPSFLPEPLLHKHPQISHAEITCSLLLLHKWHPNPTRGVSQCSLAIYIKKTLKAKEEFWKLKYFTMQQYNLQNIPLQETKILQDTITL